MHHICSISLMYNFLLAKIFRKQNHKYTHTRHIVFRIFIVSYAVEANVYGTGNMRNRWEELTVWLVTNLILANTVYMAGIKHIATQNGVYL